MLPVRARQGPYRCVSNSLTRKYQSDQSLVFRKLHDPDRFRIAQLRADPFERGDDALGLVVEAGIDRRREAREGVDRSRSPDLAAYGELIKPGAQSTPSAMLSAPSSASSF